ncbi:hypothetical protein E4T56_gene1161 [Termitomyces sp. T112]|nr:hypothetical protein E4T56_gene1161 [Termitomyces sp. T112]
MPSTEHHYPTFNNPTKCPASVVNTDACKKSRKNKDNNPVNDPKPKLTRLLVARVLDFVNDQSNTDLKISTLLTIGFICETIKPKILRLHSNKILTAIIHGACKEELSAKVQLAAIHALYNSLKFVHENFECEVPAPAVAILVGDGKKLAHDGTKAEFVGSIELFYNLGHHHEFLSLFQELTAPGEMRQADIWLSL